MTRMIFTRRSMMLMSACSMAGAAQAGFIGSGLINTGPPTGVVLSPGVPDIRSNVATGAFVALLSTIGGTAPFTYSVVTNNKFAVSGAQLVRSNIGTLTAGVQESIDIQTTDANGNSFIQTGVIVTVSSATLPAYAYEAETTLLVNTTFAGLGITTTAADKIDIDIAIKRLKSSGLWTKLKWLNMYHPAETGFMVDWITQTTSLTKVGAPTWTSPVATVGGADPIFLDSAAHGFTNGKYYTIPGAINNSSIYNPNNFSFGISVTNSGSATGQSFDAGVIDGSGNGVALGLVGAAGQHPASKCFGSNNTHSTYSGTARGSMMIVRNNNASYKMYHNGVLKDTVTSASGTPATSSPIGLGYVLNNGAASSVHALGAAWVGDGTFTDADAKEMDAIVRVRQRHVAWGAVNLQPYGVQPQNLSDPNALLIYGWTPAACMMAFEAARQGITVYMIGGWCDYTASDIGGMVSNGLSWTDVNSANFITGLPWQAFVRAAQANNGSLSVGTLPTPLPSKFAGVMHQMLNGTLYGTPSVPVFITGGALSASVGTNTITLNTQDGRSFTGLTLIDCSYEQDASLALNAALLHSGREASSSFSVSFPNERSYAGFRPIGNSGFVFGGTEFAPDPFVVPGNSGSGLLPSVTGVAPGTASGAADNSIQANGYRLAQSGIGWNGQRWMQYFNSTPPAGYDASMYEILGRAFGLATAGGKTPALSELFNIKSTSSSSTYDFNTAGGMSVDLLNSGNEFRDAGLDVGAKIACLQKLQAYTMGLFYYYALAGDQGPGYDTRVPTGIRSLFGGSSPTYGPATQEFLEPGPYGLINIPTQQYVRQRFRLTGGIIVNGSPAIITSDDCQKVTGDSCRISGNTCTYAAYPFDSHSHTRYYSGFAVKQESGTPAGTATWQNPLPFEIFMPDKSVQANVACIYGPAVTNLAYLAIRLEPTLMQAGWMFAFAMKALLNALPGDPTRTLQDQVTTHYSEVLALANASTDGQPYLPNPVP